MPMNFQIFREEYFLPILNYLYLHMRCCIYLLIYKRDPSQVSIRDTHKSYTDKEQLSYELRLRESNCIVVVLSDRKKRGVILRILNYSSGCQCSKLYHKMIVWLWRSQPMSLCKMRFRKIIGPHSDKQWRILMSNETGYWRECVVGVRSAAVEEMLRNIEIDNL